MPVAHFKDWLAEWGREARRRQAGLLLVSAHRAKGLEFDHVAVLDGSWHSGINEEADAVRRLYYVAMTRARKTLTLVRLDAGYPLLNGLPDMPGLFRRQPGQIATPEVKLNLQYVQPSLKEINLGYAGRFKSDHPLHGRIARLAHGSPLDLQEVDGAWYLLDEQEHRVGKMASTFAPPRGMRGEVRSLSWA